MIEIQCQNFFHSYEKHFHINELLLHLREQQFHFHAKRFHSNELHFQIQFQDTNSAYNSLPVTRKLPICFLIIWHKIRNPEKLLQIANLNTQNSK